MKYITALLLSCLLYGCNSPQQAPKELDYHPKLAVAKSGNQNVVFAFTSRIGYVYTICYDNPRTGTIASVPGCIDIRGTGKLIQFTKRFKSSGPLPLFTLEHAKIK